MQTAARLDVLKQQEVDRALGPLRSKFTADLPAQAELIDALMVAAEGAVEPSLPLRQAQSVAHRLAGVSAILGFEAVGRLAQAAEMALSRYVASHGAEIGLDEIGDRLDALVIEMDRQARLGPRPEHA